MSVPTLDGKFSGRFLAVVATAITALTAMSSATAISSASTAMAFKVVDHSWTIEVNKSFPPHGVLQLDKSPR